jgi:hypothetical protein
MPFLGPALAIWITLAVVGLAYYFVFIVRSGPASGSVEPTRRTESPRWAEPARNPVPGYGSTSSTSSTSYDMEAFPDEQWRREAG